MRVKIASLCSRVAVYTLTQFQQPALSVRVEESVCEVIAVVFWYFERLVLDALIQILKQRVKNV